MSKCIICNNSQLRFLVMELVENKNFSEIKREIKSKLGLNISLNRIIKHIRNHEDHLQLWTSIVRSKYSSQQEREKFEQGFLSRVSFAQELYNKYLVLSDLFDIVVGDPKKPNAFVQTSLGITKITSLTREMHVYLKELMGLQKQKDFIVEFAKVLLFTMGEGLIDRLKFVLNDLPVERREIVGRIIREEIKKGLEYSKGFSKEKVDDLMSKAEIAYNELTSRVGEK